MALDIANMQTTVGGMQRNYLFVFGFDTLPLALAESEKVQPIKDDVDLYNTKAPFPAFSTNMTKKKWGGKYFWVPTTDDSSGDGDFTFYCDSDYKMYDFWCEFKRLTGNEEANAQSAAAVTVCNAHVIMYDVDKTTQLRVFTYENFKVKSVKLDDLNKEGEDVQVVTVHANWNISRSYNPQETESEG